MTTLVWFRQDLRLSDNPALTWAASQGKVLPIYIWDDKNAGEHLPGGASQWWLHQSLQALNTSLDGWLQFFRGDPQAIIRKLLEDADIQAVVWNRCYEPWQIQRDKDLKSWLQEQDIPTQSFNSHLLWEPWQIAKQDGTPYKVFTPYYRKGCLPHSNPRLPHGQPEPLDIYQQRRGDIGLDALELMPEIHWYQQIQAQWTPGEQGAKERLSVFLQDAAKEYQNARNIPSQPGTSMLSPHLHFGEISPQQVWYAAVQAFDGHIDNKQLDCFLSELGWREFSYYLLYHWPSLPSDNFNKKFDRFSWREDDQALRAWQRGQTGIPIVDAGMRELWQTGYMHNRVRMVVGSFLVKNLLLHWHQGEAWFWDCLLDADLASNSASWQWVAGSGADAAPYFRIFNPVTQGQKFDSEGDYVRQYCPELEKLPNKYIHNPWEAPEGVLEDAGIQLGEDYPEPLVDLKESRKRALDAFAQIKDAS